jgi:hypothetical protein
MEQGCRVFVDTHIKGHEGTPVAMYEPIRAFLIEMPLRLVLGLGDTAPEIVSVSINLILSFVHILPSQTVVQQRSAVNTRHDVHCADSNSSVSVASSSCSYSSLYITVIRQHLH